MSKVICDVCGTTFPETANQCPICGSARNASAQTAADNGAHTESGPAYSHVSGGRFSKSNVQKRNKTGKPMQRSSGEPAQKGDDNGSNKGLVIVVIALLLAIIAVCIYIGITLFAPDAGSNAQKETTARPTQTQTQTMEPTETETEPTGIACTEIQLSSTIIEFTDMEKSQLLSAILTPLNTTDELVFESQDPAVATVTDGGLITPVGEGETIITITCGEIQKECRVVCNLIDATQPEETEPEETEPEEQVGNFELTFNTKFVTSEGVGDVTLKVGDKWRVYSTMNVEASKVIWTSDNEAVATIKDGVVTVVGYSSKAYILVHGEYGGVKYSCRIRVPGGTATSTSQPSSSTQQTQTTQPTQPVSGVTLSLNRSDFTLNLNGTKSHDVYKGTPISSSVSADSITWTSENPAVCTVENGVVTAVAAGYTQVFAEYNGQKVSTIVRVK